jgi:membrane-associated phospholipid phosphatase
VKPLSRTAQLWLLSFLLSASMTVISFKHLDVAIAHFVYPLSGHLGGLGAGLGSAVLLTIEAVACLTLVTARIMRGRLSPIGEAVALACISSICVYAINSGVLKVWFGVAPPHYVLNGVSHSLHILRGSPFSSFPSGHMALAGAFAGVFMRLYPRSVLLLLALLAVAAGLLILGDWHFVSDVIAGTFIGISTGMLAGEVWLEHTKTHTAD